MPFVAVYTAVSVGLIPVVSAAKKKWLLNYVPWKIVKSTVEQPAKI